MAFSTTFINRQSTRSAFVEAISTVFHRSARRDGKLLDVRGLSDYMKRDLGFLDGKDPAGSIR
jgi:hypothetical protein